MLRPMVGAGPFPFVRFVTLTPSLCPVRRRSDSTPLRQERNSMPRSSTSTTPRATCSTRATPHSAGPKDGNPSPRSPTPEGSAACGPTMLRTPPFFNRCNPSSPPSGPKWFLPSAVANIRVAFTGQLARPLKAPRISSMPVPSVLRAMGSRRTSSPVKCTVIWRWVRLPPGSSMAPGEEVSNS